MILFTVARLDHQSCLAGDITKLNGYPHRRSEWNTERLSSTGYESVCPPDYCLESTGSGFSSFVWRLVAFTVVPRFDLSCMFG